jgi:hypothetical protein
MHEKEVLGESRTKNAGVSSFKGKAYHMPSFGSGESKVLSAGGYDSEKEELYRWLHAFEESEKSFHSFTLFCEHKVTVDIPIHPISCIEIT